MPQAESLTFRGEQFSSMEQAAVCPRRIVCLRSILDRYSEDGDREGADRLVPASWWNPAAAVYRERWGRRRKRPGSSNDDRPPGPTSAPSRCTEHLCTFLGGASASNDIRRTSNGRAAPGSRIRSNESDSARAVLACGTAAGWGTRRNPPLVAVRRMTLGCKTCIERQLRNDRPVR